MKKHSRIGLLLIISLSLVLTGCTGLYNSIPKDTVMVKKLEGKDGAKESQIEAELTEEAIRTLSVKAVNKYFKRNFALDDVEIEMKPLDGNSLKALLAQETMYLDLAPEVLDAYKSQLREASGGLYAIKISHLFNANENYGVVINPQNGDILEFALDYDIRKMFNNPVAEVYMDESTQMPDNLPTEVNMDELTQLAKQYIEENEILDPVHVPIRANQLQGFMKNWLGSRVYFPSKEHQKKLGRMENLHTFEVFYVSEDRQEMLGMTINADTKEVARVTKGIMAVLHMIQWKYFI
jgi:hypothetical protein